MRKRGKAPLILLPFSTLSQDKSLVFKGTSPTTKYPIQAWQLVSAVKSCNFFLPGFFLPSSLYFLLELEIRERMTGSKRSPLNKELSMYSVGFGY